MSLIHSKEIQKVINRLNKKQYNKIYEYNLVELQKHFTNKSDFKEFILDELCEIDVEYWDCIDKDLINHYSFKLQCFAYSLIDEIFFRDKEAKEAFKNKIFPDVIGKLSELQREYKNVEIKKEKD
ncbi:hypothetical protein CQA53_08975 [Helicobacter didelphidarum]|uniref:Uncharacterized protein n=1 Tax=Helicobacter didelphidarum TaxID=2040648 RepID=A0A3D8ICM5_9HELI|nr:hypothetical protein [Helicobacter didelphidarum]RDU62830.1 hypothetical protein CQA53_08975 [Helicobacter didelphidarum]